jgi:hypothetical protein
MWRMCLLGPTPVSCHLPRLAYLTIPGRRVARRSPLLLQVGQLPDFSKEPTWDAVPSAMELAGEIPLANLGDDQYVPILGEDNLAEDRKKLEGKRADNESAQTPNDAPAGPEAPSTDANAIPAKPQCHGKQDCKVLNKKLAKMERKMWLSTKLEEKKRAHDAVRHLVLTPATHASHKTLSTRARDAWGRGVSVGVVHGER